MATKLWAIALVFFTTLLTSSAQILYKKAVGNLSWNIFQLIANYYLIGGLALYAIGGILMIIALKGGEVSVLYPIFATSYIWVSMLSVFFIGEKMNSLKWTGVVIIILGISLIGFGGNKNRTKNGN